MVQQNAVTFESAGLEIEGAYYTPDDVTPRRAAVVCHPHPNYGGDMYNLVVTVIVRGLIEAGMGALTFNFRGVGASEGAFDNGGGEVRDVGAALAFARGLPGVESCGLAGYSFGAAMAAGAVDAQVARLALVALPAGMTRGADALRAYAGPVLMVSGANDDISREDALNELAATLAPAPRVVLIPNADHFWWGQERALCDTIREFFREE